MSIETMHDLFVESSEGRLLRREAYPQSHAKHDEESSCR